MSLMSDREFFQTVLKEFMNDIDYVCDEVDLVETSFTQGWIARSHLDQTVSDWISCTDRLPTEDDADEYCHLWVMNKDGSMGKAPYGLVSASWHSDWYPKSKSFIPNPKIKSISQDNLL